MKRALVCVFGLWAVAGCSSEAVLDAEPVFALDRDAASAVEPIDDARGDVLPAVDLQVLLQALLTDHATLSNETMRRAIDGGDATSTRARLTENTDQLTRAIGLVYGPAGAHAFDQLWTNHIEFFNGYSTALANGDDDAAAAIRTRLSDYEHDFSDFLSVATDEILGFESALHVLHSHVDQMLDQADAWARGDRAQALDLAADAFDHTALIASALAASIASQHPIAFPGSLGDDTAPCVARHLAARAAVVAAADIALAGQLADAEYLDAANDRRRAEGELPEPALGDDVPSGRAAALAIAQASAASSPECSN